jgi:hypothetical protein
LPHLKVMRLAAMVAASDLICCTTTLPLRTGSVNA